MIELFTAIYRRKDRPTPTEEKIGAQRRSPARTLLPELAGGPTSVSGQAPNSSLIRRPPTTGRDGYAFGAFIHAAPVRV